MTVKRTALVLGLLAVLAGPAQAGDEPAEKKPAEKKTDEKKPAEKKPAEDKKTKEQRRAERRARKLARKKARQAKLDKNKRQLDTASPQAFAIEKKLVVPARLATDGTVLLRYTFTETNHKADFQGKGFQTESRAGPRWRKHRWQGRKPKFLALSVSSTRKGFFRHKLDMAEKYEVIFHLRVDRMTRRSDLVFFVGKIGARFGSQLVGARSSSFRTLSRAKPNREAFARGERVSVKLKVADGDLSMFVNGTQVASSDRMTRVKKKLKGKLGEMLNGRIGIYARDMNLVLFGVEIKGKVDKAKL